MLTHVSVPPSLRRTLVVLALSLATLLGASLATTEQAHAVGRNQSQCSTTVPYVPGSPIPCPTYTYQGASCTGEIPYAPGSPIPCPTIFGGNDHRAHGYVDGVSRAGVSGWARDLDVAGPINVDVWVNGLYRTTLAANQYRPDLAAAGIGNSGFSGAMTLNPGDQVTLYALGAFSSGLETGSDPWLPSSAPGNLTTITVP